MGGSLTVPVELIRIERSGGEAYRHAVAEMQGWRLSFQDAHSTCLRKSSSAAFWLLDGHGGDGAASFCAPELVREFQEDLGETGSLPSDDRLEQGFVAVDERHRASLGEDYGKASGATAGGVLVARQSDGSYSLKLVCCGDVCGMVVRSPSEKQDSAASLSVKRPAHVEPDCEWPLVVATAPHRPDHPVEMARIKAAGGSVPEGDPPRLDGSLTVSRAFGDFEYKSDKNLSAAEQKLSCVPDVYHVSGLQPGSLCLLGGSELFRSLPGPSVAGLVRDRLVQEPKADLGDLAAGLLRAGLRMNCRGDMTLMIISLSDGTDWASSPSEVQSFEKLDEQELAGMPEDTSRQYLAFLRRAGFPAKPCQCSTCGRWVDGMSRCACQEAVYCSKRCQKSAWKEHKLICTAVRQKSG